MWPEWEDLKTLVEPKIGSMNASLTAKGCEQFRRKLLAWYRMHARRLPVEGGVGPVPDMALRDHAAADAGGGGDRTTTTRFWNRFPTLISLALAGEEQVLAVWSGLGYYRRARMLHKAAQFIMRERQGELPTSSAELRTLPGIGEYTSAAIASIAFGESVAVVDGNVERVLLRVTGRARRRDAGDQGVSQHAGEGAGAAAAARRGRHKRRRRP